MLNEVMRKVLLIEEIMKISLDGVIENEGEGRYLECLPLFIA